MNDQLSGRPAQPTIHVIGGVTVDLIMGPVAPWPRPGTETFVDHSELRAGGPAGNTALALRALGVPPSRRLQHRQRHVRRSGLPIPSAKPRTAGSACAARPRSRSASSIPAASARSSPPPATLPSRPPPTFSACCRRRAAARRHRAAHRRVPLSGAARLLRHGARHHRQSAASPWRSTPAGRRTAGIRRRRAAAAAWLAHCDHVLLNEIECLSLSGADVDRCGRRLDGRAGRSPAPSLVIKRGAAGRVGMGRRRGVHVPAPVVEVVDTTGAGDAFNAGYLSARLAGASVEAALEDGRRIGVDGDRLVAAPVSARRSGRRSRGVSRQGQVRDREEEQWLSETTPQIRSRRQHGAGHRRLARHRPRLCAGLRRFRRRRDRRRAQGRRRRRRWPPRSKPRAAGFGRRDGPHRLAGMREAVAKAHKAFGRIDVLVNNVGLGPENLAENVTEADFDFTVDVNLKGTFFTTQAVGRLMIAQKSGRIINISSQAGSVTLKGEAIYCMTKAAINHLTRCLAAEWARARHHRQQRCADLHLDRRHAAEPRRPGLPRACARPHPARPHRRPDRRRRHGGVPGLAGGIADHRRQHHGRWRLVGGVEWADPDRRVLARMRQVSYRLRGLSGNCAGSSVHGSNTVAPAGRVSFTLRVAR